MPKQASHIPERPFFVILEAHLPLYCILIPGLCEDCRHGARAQETTSSEGTVILITFDRSLVILLNISV